MALYTHRVQAVLTEEQYTLLLELSQKTGQPISALVREAVVKTYFEKKLLEVRQAALERLLALEAPVADWSEMEAEIERGAVE
ncbi:MAG TPA: ribbon-helix-helix domain-containing protein [Anaerolineales bacterium]|nr:ribbon-helix-helix domain-containing protein [Anaerolineales bacterium]